MPVYKTSIYTEKEPVSQYEQKDKFPWTFFKEKQNAHSKIKKPNAYKFHPGVNWFAQPIYL